MELFDNRASFRQVVSRYAAAAPLIAELRNAIAREEPVEGALPRYRTLAEEGDPGTTRRLVALRFYLQEIIDASTTEWVGLASGVTNYAALLNIIERWRVSREDERVLLVTFNYDLMLEHACGLVAGFDAHSLDDYAFGQPYLIIKPHGSLNWRRLTRLPASEGSAARLIDTAPSLEISEDFVLVAGTSSGKAEIPAIAVPTQEKSVFECPQEHIGAFQHNLGSVDRLLILGWRAQEESFLSVLADYLSQRDVQGLVVNAGRADADETVLRLRQALPDAAIFPSDTKGFSQLLTDEQHISPVLGRELA